MGVRLLKVSVSDFEFNSNMANELDVDCLDWDERVQSGENHISAMPQDLLMKVKYR